VPDTKLAKAVRELIEQVDKGDYRDEEGVALGNNHRYRTVKDLVAAMRKRTKPSKT